MGSRSLVLDHYAYEELAEGVSFGHARREGAALSNNGIVDLGGSTLIFDTSLTPRAAKETREAARTLTGRAPTFTANSHWHLDHILGNQEFGDRPIYATRRTAEILVERRAELELELTPAKIRADVAAMEERRNAATTHAGREAYDAVLRINLALLEDAVDLRLVAPTTTFEGELDLPGDGGARLMTFGAGHTESDAVLFLPKERILFAGDLVVAGDHPNLGSGDPQHWIQVLDRLAELRPERVGTGHGPLGSAETLSEVRDYLTTVIETAQQDRAAEMPARFVSWGEPAQFEANVAYTRTLLDAAK
jgi:cyclase